MRGFRGSRAAQNSISRFDGRHDYRRQGTDPGHPDFRHGWQNQPSQRPDLPDWLKTAETKAREQAEAQQQQRSHPQQKPAHLTLVVNHEPKFAPPAVPKPAPAAAPRPVPVAVPKVAPPPAKPVRAKAAAKPRKPAAKARKPATARAKARKPAKRKAA